MSGVTKWYADELKKKVRVASVLAINDVTSDARDDAKESHNWRSQSGRLEANIVNEPAQPTLTGARGRFGTTQRQGFYGLFMERRYPFLRPAADRNFTKIAGAIRERLRW